MKARLTSRQVVAAVIAGIVGHLLFGGGWTLLGVVLFGGLLTGILGVTLSGLVELISGDNPAATELFDSAGGVIGSVFVGIAITALVLMLIGFLASGWILRGGRVRKPWGTTFWSVLIVAVLSVPLLLVYLGISGRGDGALPFPLVAFLGTLIVGVLVWLWMTWAHRGRVPELTTGESTPAAPAVES
ncbi:hypothetical protein [Schumannella luteola]